MPRPVGAILGAVRRMQRVGAAATARQIGGNVATAASRVMRPKAVTAVKRLKTATGFAKVGLKGGMASPSTRLGQRAYTAGTAARKLGTRAGSAMRKAGTHISARPGRYAAGAAAAGAAGAGAAYMSRRRRPTY